MSTEIIERTAGAAPIVYDEEKLAVIKNTLAQGATDAELSLFVQLCKSTGLNPFQKEIWFIKTKGYAKRDGTQVGGRVQLMTGVDGFYRIAYSHPQ